MTQSLRDILWALMHKLMNQIISTNITFFKNVTDIGLKETDKDQKNGIISRKQPDSLPAMLSLIRK